MVFKERKKYKKLQKEAKTTSEKVIYQQREMVYKLIGNSSYGRFGNLKGKYPCMYVCSFITLMARRNILLATAFIKKHYPSLDVIYIDTDGYILTNSEKKEDSYYVQISDHVNGFFNNLNLPYIQIVNEQSFDYACIMTKKKYILYNADPNNKNTVTKIKATGFVKSQNECVRNCFYFAVFTALRIFTNHSDIDAKDLIIVTKFVIFSFWKYLNSLSLEECTLSLIHI